MRGAAFNHVWIRNHARNFKPSFAPGTILMFSNLILFHLRFIFLIRDICIIRSFSYGQEVSNITECCKKHCILYGM